MLLTRGTEFVQRLDGLVLRGRQGGVAGWTRGVARAFEARGVSRRWRDFAGGRETLTPRRGELQVRALAPGFPIVEGDFQHGLGGFVQPAILAAGQVAAHGRDGF